MKRLVFSLFVILSLTWVPASKAADIQGTFFLVPQKSDNVAHIEESILAKMNFFVRPFARDKITKVARVHKRVSIALSVNEISVVADDYVLPPAPTDGTILIYHNREGDALRFRTRLVGNKLEQTFFTDKGSRTNFCELSQDGNTLEMHVVIKSYYFDKPMTYTLVYYKES
ncbi:MAG: hypothetical protein ACLQVJ_07395 [Syntrophobacteraceae bacterium]